MCSEIHSKYKIVFCYCIFKKIGANVRLTNVEVSLIEGESTRICVALEEGQLELLDRMVSIVISSDEVSKMSQGMTCNNSAI